MQSSWPLRRRDTDTWARGKLAQNGSSRANEKDIKRERLAWRGWLKLMGSLSGGVGSSGLAVRAIFNGFCLPLRTQHITVSLFCMAKVKPRCLTVRSSCHLPPKRRQRLFQRVAGTVFVIQSPGLALRQRVVSWAKSCIIPGRSWLKTHAWITYMTTNFLWCPIRHFEKKKTNVFRRRPHCGPVVSSVVRITP